METGHILIPDMEYPVFQFFISDRKRYIIGQYNKVIHLGISGTGCQPLMNDIFFYFSYIAAVAEFFSIPCAGESLTEMGVSLILFTDLFSDDISDIIITYE